MTKVIKWKQLNVEEQALCVFLQGVLNRIGVKVYVDIENYMTYLNDTYEYIDIYDLIKENSNYFKGIVSYKLDCEDVAINMTAMLCAKYDYLGVPDKLANKISNISSLNVVRDMSEIKGSRAHRQKVIFDEVKDS